jgi:hypothetical protein
MEIIMPKIIRTFIKNCLPYGISHYFVVKNGLSRKSKLSLPLSEEPPVYNINGQKFKTIFLKDDGVAWDHSYSFVNGRYPCHILWDRYNYGLKNHVYVQKNIMPPRYGKPVKKFAFFIESESIVPGDYELFNLKPGLDRDFDLIFTHTAEFLDKYPNAVFIPGGGVWYGSPNHGGTISPEQYKYKTKNISIVSSNKQLCELHSFRMNIAKKCKFERLADTFGNFDGGPKCKIAETLENYRYSIGIENHISSYYFTEKIMNCFASMTIPIYYGASRISDYFNPDGIIIIPDMNLDNIANILKNCNESEYQSRLSAVIDNFNRVQEFLSLEDYLYKHYKNHFAE